MFSRREFLQRAAMLSGGLGTLAAIPPALLKALEIEPAEGTTFMDAEHVVILMQENRSFDHAYGTLQGVRGFNDPRPITIPGGNPVWLQTDARGATFAPFGLNIHESKSTWMRDLPHDRRSQVAAGNKGKHDRWLKVKQSGNEEYAEMPLTIGYYDRRDIPFYYAFADAFTLCDQHFCSVQTCTTPNRLFLWTGTNRDPRDPSATVRLANGQIDHDSHADWITFPERLEDAGVSWKIYQNEIDLPTGLQPAEEAWLGNFGDNPMEYFTQYHAEFAPAHMAHLRRRLTALKKKIATLSESGEKPAELEKARESLPKLQAEVERCSPENFSKLPARERSLHKKAFTTNTGDPNQRKLVTLKYRDGETEREMAAPAGDVLHQFRQDVDTSKLPAVSWLVAPAHFSDHPGVPWYGAWYVSEVLDILTRDPEVWKKTIFILTYDENDGYYDHIPPFVPPHSAQPESGAASAGIDTAGEFDEKGNAIGLGYRVPMVIASPWSRGGNVCSQVFDHTSVLQFLEVFLKGKAAASVTETNISAWRRTICGDLTAAFQPSTGQTDKHPLPLKRDAFVESIHKAKFKSPPANFKALSENEIQEIRLDPAASPLLPKQEPGTRPSCALPYELFADGRLSADGRSFEILFRTGARSVGAPFHVYAPGNYLLSDVVTAPEAEAEPPVYDQAKRWSFAVATGQTVRYAWPVESFEGGRYHLRVYGPNGFYREFQGTSTDPLVDVTPAFDLNQGPAIALTIGNRQTSGELSYVVTDQSYGRAPVTRVVPAGTDTAVMLNLSDSSGWYDFTLAITGRENFARRYAGRVETGKHGITDPLLGRAPIPTVQSEKPPTDEPETRTN